MVGKQKLTYRYYVLLIFLVFSSLKMYAQRPTFDKNEEKTTSIPNLFNFGQDSSTRNVMSRKAPTFFAESYRFVTQPLKFNTESDELFPVFCGQGLFFHQLKDKFPLRLGVSSWNISARTRVYYVIHPDSMREQKRILAAVKQAAKSNILGASYREQNEHIVFAKSSPLPINILNNKEVKNYQSTIYEGRVSRNVWFSASQIKIPNTENYSIAHPCLSKDGKTLFFTANLPNGYGGTDIYMSTKKEDGTWSEPQNLGNQVNSAADELTPFYHSEDGNLYFASNRVGGMGGFDIYEAKKEGDFFEKVKDLGAPINSEDDDISFIVNDAKRRGYFASNRRGNFDIFKVDVLLLNITRNLTDGGENVFGQFNFELTGNVFDSISGQPIKKALVKLREISDDDIRVAFTDNSGKYRFQVQNEKRYQLAVSKLGYQTTKDYEFSTLGILKPTPITVDLMMPPVNYRFRLNIEIVEKDSIPEINKKPIADARLLLEEMNTHEQREVYADLQGKYSFDLQQDKDYKVTASHDGFEPSPSYRFHAERRNNAQSLDFQIPLEKIKTNKRRAVIRAIVTDTEDGKALIGANVMVKNKNTGQEITGITDENGVAIFVVDTLYTYELWSAKEKYQAPNLIDVDAKGVEAGKVIEAILPMKAVKYKPVALNFALPSVYYPAGKITFNEEVQTQLDMVVKVMKEYEGLKINILSHTDNTDRPKSNDELARQRANAAVSYLIRKGIEKRRILNVMPLGATKMRYDCSKMNCTEAQHAENRRIDFVIIER